MATGIYIPSIDAKDLYLAGDYNLNQKDGNVNLKRFKNTFDYSLDLIELRGVAAKIYKRGEKLTFIEKNKEYSSKVINVTYKYCVRDYNELMPGLFVKAKHRYSPADVVDGVVIDNGELLVVDTNIDIINPLPQVCNSPYFEFKGGKYVRTKKSFKLLKSAKELRRWTYTEGFMVNGIHYCRFKRSSGSARVGKCLFIDERLYPDMHKSEQCGLDINIGDPLDIAAFEAYIALPSSSIIDTIDISPENILLIDDFESVFNDDAVCTDLGEGGSLITYEKEMKITNSIWDGQSLIDVSLMGVYKDKGMLLLRNKFFKSCCFNTNIQQFFKDNGITELSQINGKTIATSVEQIKLITTPSSIKFLKFGDLQTWFDNIYPYFGIVKYDKNTHFFDGRMVQAHYQLLNTLQLSKEEVDELVKDSLDYVSLLNTDLDVLRYHLKCKIDNIPPLDNIMKNKNEIVYKLLCYDCGFENTDVFYSFKRELCKAYLKNMKRGHILINGTYATLFGNPLEMLKQSVGIFDGTTSLLPGTVHNIRYPYGMEILGSRSPHVTVGNILITKNVENEEIDKYFNLTNNIICINSINDNILERLSGADFDSDTMLITNNSLLVNTAKKNYSLFKVPTRNINPPKSKRHYTMEDIADLDYKTCSNKIGEIVNLSQELNSLMWDIISKSGGSVHEQYQSVKEIYYDACQLDVLSNIEIDRAKKEFPVNSAKELNKMREKYSTLLTCEDGRKMMPSFLGFIAELKDYRNDEKKNYVSYDTTMDYLLDSLSKKQTNRLRTKNIVKIQSIFKPNNYDKGKVKYTQIKKVFELGKNALSYNNSIYSGSLSRDEKLFYRQQNNEAVLYEINKMKINEHTMYKLLNDLNACNNIALRNYMFYILFNYKNEVLSGILQQYKPSKTYVTKCDENGEKLSIYGEKYTKKST